MFRWEATSGGIARGVAESSLDRRPSVRRNPLNNPRAKLRRLADCIEQEKRFRIQVAGERVSVPPDAIINIEHEREGRAEEIEFQLKWRLE